MCNEETESRERFSSLVTASQVDSRFCLSIVFGLMCYIRNCCSFFVADITLSFSELQKLSCSDMTDAVFTNMKVHSLWHALHFAYC